MEDKHIVIAAVIGLVVILGILGVTQAYKSPEVGGGFGFFDFNKDSSSLKSPSPTPLPVVTQLSAQDLRVGSSSAAVVSGDAITVNYEGAFLDGKIFDSSLQRQKPFSFVVGAGSVIQGFDQGVIGMKIGGIRRIMIPSNLAYGEKGQGPIPPNTAILFNVQLLEIAPKDTPTPTPSPEPTPNPSPAESPTPTPNP